VRLENENQIAQFLMLVSRCPKRQELVLKPDEIGDDKMTVGFFGVCC
jgi:hypothetical protein